MTRRRCVAEGLARVRDRIVRAATAVGRDPAEVRLIAVSKTKPASAIREAYAAGQRDFGENYAQELVQKAEELADLTELRWHFIGHLQTNKARFVARIAHMVHTVDGPSLARELGKRAAKDAARARAPPGARRGERRRRAAEARRDGRRARDVLALGRRRAGARAARADDDAAERPRGRAPRLRGALVAPRAARRREAPARALDGHERRPRDRRRLRRDHGARRHGHLRRPLTAESSIASRSRLAAAPAGEGVAEARERAGARAAGADALRERAVRLVGRVERERAIDRVERLVALTRREERRREHGERARRLAVELARAPRVLERGLGILERDMRADDLEVRGRAAGRDAKRLAERVASGTPVLEPALRDAHREVRRPRGVDHGELARARGDRVEILRGRVVRGAQDRVELERGLRILEREARALRLGRERRRRRELLDVREPADRRELVARLREGASEERASPRRRWGRARRAHARACPRGRRARSPSGSAASESWIARFKTSGCAGPRTSASSTRRAAATASRRSITSEARFVNAGG